MGPGAGEHWRTRGGGWFAIHVANPVDQRLLRWTNGRVGFFFGQPVGLLHTVGAKSGERRTTPLLYLADGDRIVLVASMAGAARNPAWFHNLVAHPEVEFMPRGGARTAYVARVAEGPGASSCGRGQRLLRRLRRLPGKGGGARDPGASCWTRPRRPGGERKVVVRDPHDADLGGGADELDLAEREQDEPVPALAGEAVELAELVDHQLDLLGAIGAGDVRLEHAREMMDTPPDG